MFYVDPMVVWDVTLYNLVHSCQYFRATCLLSHFLNTDNFRIAHPPSCSIGLLLNIYRLALLYASEGLSVTSPLEV